MIQHAGKGLQSVGGRSVIERESTPSLLMLNLKPMKTFRRMTGTVAVVVATMVIVISGYSRGRSETSMRKNASITSLALRVHNTDQMLKFYAGAFGVQFREVDARGIRSHFGELGGITLKLVPIRDGSDFEGFPVHQPGFTVGNIYEVIALAVKHGGRQEGTVIQTGKRRHAAVRDPDGNTIELYDEQ